MRAPILAAILLGLAAEAGAVVPQRIGYQGFLRESGGLAVGNKTMVFKIYASSDVAAPVIWNSGNLTVTVSTGIFHVNLDVTGVDFEAANAWLEITVNGTTLSPREQLTAGPYALNALYHAGKRYISSGTTPSGTVAPGDLWFDNAANVLYYRTGAPAWQPLSAAGLTTHAITHSGGNTDPITSLGAVTYTANQTLASGIAIGSAGDGVRVSSHVIVAANGAIALSGAKGVIVGQSSITASGFFGDGSGLTNVSGVTAGTIDSVKLAKASVDSEKVVLSSIGREHLVDLTIDSAKLGRASVDVEKLAPGAVSGAAVSAGSLDSTKLAKASVDSEKIARASIDSEKLLKGGVNSEKVALGSIGKAHLLDGAVETAKLAIDAVTNATIRNGSVSAEKLAAGAVSAAALAGLSIDSSKLAALSVDSEKIARASIDSEKLLKGAVNSEKVALNSIGKAHLLDGAVETAKLAIDAVTNGTIRNGSVSAEKLAAGAVSATALAALSIDSTKLAVLSVDSEKIARASIDSEKLLKGAVNSEKVALGSIGKAHLVDGAVETAKHATDSVTSAAIRGGAVTADKLAPGAVSAAALAPLSIDSTKLAALSVDSEKIARASIDSEKLLKGAVNSEKVALGSIGKAHLVDGAVETAKLARGAVDTTNVNNDAVDTRKIFYTDHRMNSLSLGNGNTVCGGDARLCVGGNVGIGTTSPNANLQVTGSGSFGSGVRTPALETMNIGGTNRILFDGPAGAALIYMGAQITSLTVGNSGGSGLSVNSNGNIGLRTTNDGGATGPVLAMLNNGATNPSAVAGQGILYVNGGALKYQGPTTLTQVAAADYAEAMPFRGKLEAAEVVAVSRAPKTDADVYNNFLVERSGEGYDPKIIGVVSSTTIDESTSTRMIALAGRVPVKMSLENGPVQVGDPLTSASKPGYAMKATKTARVLGIALEAFDAKDRKEGKILCFVNPHAWVNPADHLKTVKAIQELEAKNEKLQGQLRADAENHKAEIKELRQILRDNGLLK